MRISFTLVAGFLLSLCLSFPPTVLEPQKILKHLREIWPGGYLSSPDTVTRENFINWRHLHKRVRRLAHIQTFCQILKITRTCYLAYGIWAGVENWCICLMLVGKTTSWHNRLKDLLYCSVHLEDVTCRFLQLCKPDKSFHILRQSWVARSMLWRVGPGPSGWVKKLWIFSVLTGWTSCRSWRLW